MSKQVPVEVQFLRDVADHKIDIRLDEGVYRHVVLAKPEDFNCAFSLTTTPGRLVYAGDMGCYVFERTNDMFTFFRQRGDHGPNFDYWHEKLVAVDRGSGSEQPSKEKFRENLESYIEDIDRPSDHSEVLMFIDEAAGVFEEEGPDAAIRLVGDFSLDEGHTNRRQFFCDFHELGYKEYTFRYQWACHAIQWGIKLYDKQKAAVQA